MACNRLTITEVVDGVRMLLSSFNTELYGDIMHSICNVAPTSILKAVASTSL
jgi:hypothetical protein